MVIHPDGRLEGTPEELAAYQIAMKGKSAGPVVVEKIVQVPVYAPNYQPWTKPMNPHPWTEVTCGPRTADCRSGVIAMN